MGVHQLKDGRWIVQYKTRGKTKREYFGRGVVAEKTARQRNDELGLRPYTPRTPTALAPLFEDLTEAYLTRKHIDLPAASYDTMAYKIEAVILPEFGHLPVSQINRYRMDQYVSRRILAGRKKTTIHRDISVVQAILNWSVKEGYILANPIAGYKKPARDDAVIRPPSPSEAKRIIAHAVEHVARALYISYYTGLRPGQSELYPLTWDRVDWDGNTILVISAQKGGLKSRSVPLHRKLRALLEAWHESDMAASPPPGHIIHYNGQPILSMKTGFAAAKRRAGITRKITPYAFRHAFVSTILAAGGDLKSTSELAGHSRPDTTQRIYQHTTGKLHAAAIAKLPDL